MTTKGYWRARKAALKADGWRETSAQRRARRKKQRLRAREARAAARARRGAFSPRRYRLLKVAQEIRDSYADGEPLSQRDTEFMVGLLRHHPRAEAKFGAGVKAIVVDRFIGGTRCFFVIRKDGTAEDFSVPKCLGKDMTRSQSASLAMAGFRYDVVNRNYLRRLRDAQHSR